MKVYTTEVKRSVWAKKVTVSRTREGRWIIDREGRQTILPSWQFKSWDHAEWTGNAWANEELAQSLAEEVNS